MAPFLPGFLVKYNHADALFIGSPADYLTFRNMSKGDDSDDPIEIVLLDVKTGKSGLNGVQKKIEAGAAAKRVSFDVLRVDEQTVTKYSQQLELTGLPAKDSSQSDPTGERPLNHDDTVQ
jgi:predicted Holliday junction resolvase-like endonuclease